jgi:hypothetical protein
MRATLELVDGITGSPETTKIIGDRSEVRTPRDHRAFYRSEQNRAEARFLYSSRETVPFGSLWRSRSREDPRATESAVVVSLSSARTAPLHVWRCIIPGMIPMSFGFDREPLGLSAAIAMLQTSGRTTEVPLHPHPFA